MSAARPRIGISSCLLGEKVRFDGGHKRDAFLVETFGPYVEWVPVCPEMELGLGVPRETLRLERGPSGELRMVAPKSGSDHTRAMRRFARARVAALEKDELSGYVLKRASPSCGMERVKVYEGKGPPRKDGQGLFVEALRQRFPLLPLEEEGRLCDPALRENFVERVFAYYRLRTLFCSRWRVGDVVAFHTAHKLVLLAHSPQGYRELGRLVAAAKSLPRAELRRLYETGFMSALERKATRGRNTNVLMHMAGYLRRELDPPDREEVHELIGRYRAGLVPLVVPLTLLGHHIRRLDITYLRGQVYLDPHPHELMLRNHV